MKKLINEVLTVVSDSLEGFGRLQPQLAILDGYATVVRSDLSALRSSGKVAIISGGGAGHEPAHAGYVGAGMLTAAVSGDVFASPSTDAVLAALRVVGGPAGVLMIVKNYTGDRINFGLAAEMARAEGISVETVVVDDDAALGGAELTAGRRGIAGTVLVHKIAGAAAEAGLPLSEVVRLARNAAAGVSTMGVALTPCTVPAAGTASFELGPNEIELGLGIHGEAGVERRPIAPSRTIVNLIIEKLVADKDLKAHASVILLVNNLGGTPTMELNIVARDALEELARRQIDVIRAYCGTFLTAIEMAGISLSVMQVDAEQVAALDAETSAPAWLSMARTKSAPAKSAHRLLPAVSADSNSSVGHGPPASPALLDALRAACRALIAAEPKLTALDQEVGDGDIGRSLARGAEGILDSLERMPSVPARGLLADVSRIVRQSVGGTSGPLYAAFALSASNSLSAGGSAAEKVARAFSAGVESVSALGGAKEGDRTMLDALFPAARAMAGMTDVSEQLHAAAAAARRGADATAKMTPRRGRSSYLGARAIGHVDPGAEAVAIWLAAAATALEG